MEVAGQWRREWAGTAEYGKVIEGGVTRQVARAMEVLHASAPGAKVRVMRAAYHSSAGPGAPASSYMMHSSRQVISSGYNFLEPSSLPSKPLEISSTPLELLPDSEVDNENYKVTEPDDYDISEPSKWRGSTRKNSIRMPSEESSSADNASIIDLDSRTSSRSTLRRSFQSKHNEDINKIHNINTRVSPLLDAPVALSTLKYTSLLNGSDDWNNRRKSYSFEGTSPIDKSISSENNSFTIDSSTDSGICKSSEIVNDQLNSKKHHNIFEKMGSNQEETFTEWLSRNRSTSYKDMSPPKPIHVPELQKNEDKITVKSTGKVTITLPTESFKEKRTETSKYDDSDRRTKKVEFCKTELHFAVDTGTVNIIATDEKPPPSNDFRRRRSAFVPLNEKIDKSITLFGEQSKLTDNHIHESVISNTETSETDENTAATKSILKNKIPKPKPYLLGENMAFGNFNDSINDLDTKKHLATMSAVSLINRQLQERRHSNETNSSCESDLSTVLNNTVGTGSKGPQLRDSSNYKQTKNAIIEPLKHRSSDVKNSAVSRSQNKLKIRELRGSELAYFGVDDSEKSKVIHSQDNMQEEIFHSVKLVQQISSSVCNSEADSDEAPEYQNILPNYNLTVTPTPKPRSIYSDQVRKGAEPRILKPIVEQDLEKFPQSDGDRNSKKSKETYKSSHFDNNVPSRYTKEKMPRPKDIKINLTNDYSSLGRSKSTSLKRVKNNKENESSKSLRNTKPDRNIPESPVYINLQTKPDRKTPISEDKNQRLSDQRLLISANDSKSSKSSTNKIRSIATADKGDVSDKVKEHHSVVNRNNKNEIKKDSSQQPKKYPRRTEKLTTPDHLQDKFIRQRSYDKHKINTSTSNNKYEVFNTNSLKKKENKDISKMVVANIGKATAEHEANIRNATKTKTVDRPKDISKEIKTSTKSNEENQSFQYAMKLSTNKTVKTSSSNTKPDRSSKSKRSKYVINYDDKNGTVSSICKIKSVPGTYTRKLISVENKNPQECNNDKIINKIALKK
ncbi:uncharacterized protein LOC124533433 isoform X2 [Vanessa cardui]|uniref:uncharacterized protein LOC124533433 isoform X2 n=1 Tax=Vanessa cardui TaxID=171605 RepID=UPI001F13E5FE|nr:uncharacterized protein LOC124533433 isoform X2 [Vanessa cardui]